MHSVMVRAQHWTQVLFLPSNISLSLRLYAPRLEPD